MPEEVEHLGFKTLYLYLGWVLTFVAVVFEVIGNWLAAPEITMAMIQKVLVITIVLSIVVPAVLYVAHMLYFFAFKVEEKMKP